MPHARRFSLSASLTIWKPFCNQKLDMRLACDKYVKSSSCISPHFVDFTYFDIRIEQLEDRLGSGTAQAEIDILRLEQNTWGLLQAILS